MVYHALAMLLAASLVLCPCIQAIATLVFRAHDFGVALLSSSSISVVFQDSGEPFQHNKWSGLLPNCRPCGPLTVVPLPCKTLIALFHHHRFARGVTALPNRLHSNFNGPLFRASVIFASYLPQSSPVTGILHNK